MLRCWRRLRAAVFDRTYEHFCSHRQSPSSGASAGAAIVRRGNVIYFSSPLFTQYYHNAPQWCRTLFLNALDMLLPQPLVKHGGPSTLEVMLNEQPARNRLVLHLLHYIPIRRSQQIDIIEDVIPVYDVPVSICAGLCDSERQAGARRRQHRLPRQQWPGGIHRAPRQWAPDDRIELSGVRTCSLFHSATPV